MKEEDVEMKRDWEQTMRKDSRKFSWEINWHLRKSRCFKVRRCVDEAGHVLSQHLALTRPFMPKKHISVVE
jgi:hypothetical protein